ncbi:LysR family transcriptional regulator [Marinobacterium jannaschii]|uniref:LysR family transcriptional regulator n=1 Tax=Marinobacterium jannaschii TaxID=64970 RepID=UPI00048294E2|nr:LysR family transcriptional regulator [Marinobacterium jannaschii]
MDRLQSMRVFVEVVKRGSFTAAADHLDMTRVKVTRYVTALEQWLGSRLLQRSTRSISLTEAGQAFLLQCEKMLALEEDMQLSLGARDSAPKGQLRITCSTSFGQAHLADGVVEYLKRYPEVSVDLMMVDHTVNLIEERVDLAIRISGELDPGLVARRLANCESVVVASPDYLARHGTPVAPQDLVGHNCLCYANFGKGVWRFQGTSAEEVLVPVSGNLSANEVGTLTRATLAGGGIALQPTYLAGPLIRSGQLVSLLDDWSAPPMYLWGVYLSRQHVPASVRTMLDFLAERYRGVPDWDLGI